MVGVVYFGPIFGIASIMLYKSLYSERVKAVYEVFTKLCKFKQNNNRGCSVKFVYSVFD